MIKAVGEAEAEQAHYVMCVRVADLVPLDELDPHLREFAAKVRARSSTEECSWCKAPVIVDSTSPKTPARVCMPCIMERMEAEEQ